jgi:hypothetical protein
LFRSLEYVISCSVKRLHPGAFGYKLLSLLKVLQTVYLVRFAHVLVVVLFAYAERTEREALVQAFITKGMAKCCNGALVRIGGQDYREEVDSVVRSESGPSSTY